MLGHEVWDCVSIFHGTSDSMNDGQSLAAEVLERFHFIGMNQLSHVAFVLENILYTHFVVGPSLRFDVDKTLESAHRTRQRVTVTFTEIRIYFTTLERTDDFIEKIEFFIVVKEANEQITDTIFANRHFGWVLVVNYVFC